MQPPAVAARSNRATRLCARPSTAMLHQASIPKRSLNNARPKPSIKLGKCHCESFQEPNAWSHLRPLSVIVCFNVTDRFRMLKSNYRSIRISVTVASEARSQIDQRKRTHR